VTNANHQTVPDTSSPNVTVIDPSANQHCIPPDNPVPNQKEITWNVAGPRGAAGANGPAGANGAKGATGATSAPVVKVTLPKVESTAPTLGYLRLGSGKTSYRFPFLVYTEAASAAKVSLRPLLITKKVDKSSSKLFLANVQGKTYGSATLAVRKKKPKKGKPQEYLVIKLESVLVSSLRTDTSSGSPLETVTLTFGSSRVVTP
jgi:hypothetical protein